MIGGSWRFHLAATLSVLAVVGCLARSSEEAESRSDEPRTTEAAVSAPEATDAQVMQAVGADGPLASQSYTNKLRWSTASEVDNFGYDIYRSLSEEGPFERITETPIAGAGTTDEVSEYVFVDDAIEPHTEYFYYVESISRGGARRRFTPVIRAAAKLASP